MKSKIKYLVCALMLQLLASQSYAITVGLLSNSYANAASNLDAMVSDGTISSWADLDTSTFNSSSVADLASNYDVLVVGWYGYSGNNLDWATRTSALLAAGVGIIFEGPDNISQIAGASGLTFGSVGSVVFGSETVLAAPFTSGVGNNFLGHGHFTVDSYDSSWNPFLMTGSSTIGVYSTAFGAGIVIQGPDSFYHGTPGSDMYTLIKQEVLWAASPVPDSGSTVALLGLAFCAIAGVRRRFSA